jgi:hypothetical protein
MVLAVSLRDKHIVKMASTWRISREGSGPGPRREGESENVSDF